MVLQREEGNIAHILVSYLKDSGGGSNKVSPLCCTVTVGLCRQLVIYTVNRGQNVPILFPVLLKLWR